VSLDEQVALEEQVLLVQQDELDTLVPREQLELLDALVQLV